MSRTGVEAKPTWKSVPPDVRQAVELALGSPVSRAMRIWGGYSGTPTFRLRLKDGRRAFMKAASAESSEFAREAHTREERIYRELQPYIAGWSPEFYGMVEAGGWNVMLLQDLGPKSAPPWTPAMLKGVSRAFGEFHRSTLGAELPRWLARTTSDLHAEFHAWRFIETDGMDGVAGLAGARSGEARRWLESALPALATACAGLCVSGDYSLLHRDMRSDNLRWRDRRLLMLDWPHPGVGFAEYDAALFAQSVDVEGGASPEQVMGWYGERFPVRAEILDATTASLAGFFAYHAPQPEIDGLPRLRTFQRAQFKACLAWASRRLNLPAPTWLDAVS